MGATADRQIQRPNRQMRPTIWRKHSSLFLRFLPILIFSYLEVPLLVEVRLKMAAH